MVFLISIINITMSVCTSVHRFVLYSQNLTVLVQIIMNNSYDFYRDNKQG